jgi:hypothetical protein
MIMRFSVISLTLLLVSFWSWPSLAAEPWSFKLAWESSRLTDGPFLLMTSADVNRNGLQEIIVADFGRFGDHIAEWPVLKEPYANLFVFEWDKNELKLKWQKQWDMRKPKTRDERDRYFMAYEALQMTSWKLENRVIVETLPPYLGLSWDGKKYQLQEQNMAIKEKPLVGSWALPWMSPSCYPSFPARVSYPRECLVGIRDFSGKGEPKIVTMFEEEIVRNKQYKQILRVRKFESGFPIEWEFLLDSKYYFGSPRYIDRLNMQANGMLLISNLLLADKKSHSLYFFEPEPQKPGYRLNPLSQSSKGIIAKDLPPVDLMLYDYPDIYLTTYDLPDVYLRTTQKKDLWEYWGYHRIDIPNPQRFDFSLLLKKVFMKPDLTGFMSEVVDFPHHESFLGVGFFDLKDMDGDGLDEVILVEETGKKEPGSERFDYTDTKDYIRILKWDGKEYQTMWVSPPYAKRGTKFLIEDVKNTGKKQLVVMTGQGTIQIWERQ